MSATAPFRKFLAGAVLSTTVLLSAVAGSLPAHAAGENYADYLGEGYGIKWGQTITQQAFADALVKAVKLDQAALALEGKADEALSVQKAVSLAVKAAGLKELAYSYPQEKVDQALQKAKLVQKASGTLTTAQELAAAVDVGLLPEAYYQEAVKNGPVSAELASLLVGKALAFTGGYKNYLGDTAEEDIYGKLYQAWNTSTLIEAPELKKVVDEGLKQNLVTGYNLKDARYDSHFDPKLSITYGHSDITHAIQLVGLLRSEGISAKLQFEPKTSAFIYLKEWGEPQETPDYKVVQIENGNYIAYSKEYDIGFEFADQADKERFDAIISKYAKKNAEDQKGLLIASWWQPLYTSDTKLPNYLEITNNKIVKGNFIAQSFSLNEKSADVVAGFKKLDPSINITAYKFWADQPFYNYLQGESK